MGKMNPKLKARARRRKYIRNRVSGNSERLRLAVFRSAKHIYAQIIDDDKGITLAAASSASPELRERKGEFEGKKALAREVGKVLASKAKEKGIRKVTFDRGGYLFHGRIKSLADGAREAGLEF